MRSALVALIGSMATPTVVATTPVTAVAHLDLALYAGTWHEIARLPM